MQTNGNRKKEDRVAGRDEYMFLDSKHIGVDGLGVFWKYDYDVCK